MTPKQRRELLRQMRAQDPLLNFAPSPVQLAFLQSQSPHRTIIGGNRAGKTAANAVDLAYIARGIHPWRKIDRRLRILFLTNTRQQAANVIGRKLFVASELPGKFHDLPLIPPAEVQVDYLKVGVHVPYVARTKHADILFSWSAADNVWERLQGQKLDLAYFDEDAGSLKLVNEIFMRGMEARSQGIPWLGGISWSATPTTATDGYVRFRNYCKENNPSQSFFYIPPGDNPAVSTEVIAEARKFLGTRESLVRVDATKDATDLILVYGDQWSDQRHLAAEPLPIDDKTNLWLGYDPGMDHPTGMVVAAVNEAAPIHLRLVQTWWHARQTLEYDVRVLDEFLRGRKLAGVVYDWAMRQQNKTGDNLLDELIRAFARKSMSPLFGFFAAKKSRDPGILMVRHYLDPDPYDKDAPPMLRLDPITEANGLGIAKQQFLSYRGKEATRFTGEGGVVKKDDDVIDAIRYLCMHRIAWNPDGGCGPATKEILRPDTAPVDIRAPAAAAPTDPYFIHLARSRARGGRRTEGWTVHDF